MRAGFGGRWCVGGAEVIHEDCPWRSLFAVILPIWSPCLHPAFPNQDGNGETPEFGKEAFPVGFDGDPSAHLDVLG